MPSDFGLLWWTPLYPVPALPSSSLHILLSCFHPACAQGGTGSAEEFAALDTALCWCSQESRDKCLIHLWFGGIILRCKWLLNEWNRNGQMNIEVLSCCYISQRNMGGKFVKEYIHIYATYLYIIWIVYNEKALVYYTHYKTKMKIQEENLDKLHLIFGYGKTFLNLLIME